MSSTSGRTVISAPPSPLSWAGTPRAARSRVPRRCEGACRSAEGGRLARSAQSRTASCRRDLRAPAATGRVPRAARPPAPRCGRRASPRRAAACDALAEIGEPAVQRDLVPAFHSVGAIIAQTLYEETMVSRSAALARGRASAPAAARPARAARRGGGGRPGSGVKRLICRTPARAIGLQVGAADEAVADEQRQDVVAVDPLGLALVDLDQVVEAEEAPQERAVPHQVVERAQQHGAASARRRAPRRPARRPAGRRRPPRRARRARRRRARRRAAGSLRRRRRSGSARRSRTRSARRGPAPRAARSARRNSSSVGDGAPRAASRDHALGQVVDALEALPSRDRELAGGEEVLERALLRLPAPHRLAAAPRTRAPAARPRRGCAPARARSTSRPSAVRCRPHQWWSFSSSIRRLKSA